MSHGPCGRGGATPVPGPACCAIANGTPATTRPSASIRALTNLAFILIPPSLSSEFLHSQATETPHEDAKGGISSVLCTASSVQAVKDASVTRGRSFLTDMNPVPISIQAERVH